MEYNIKFDLRMDVAALHTFLRVLDSGPHGFVRPIIDDIMKQAKEQEDAAKAAPAEPAEAVPEVDMVVGGTD